MSGFEAWAAGPWGTFALLCGIVAALFGGYLFGWWRCERAAAAAGEEEHYARQEAMARRTHPVYRQPRELPADEPVLYGRRRPRDARGDPDLIGKILRQPRRTSTAAFLAPPEVAHEWGRPPGQLAEDFDVDAEIARIHAAADEIIAMAQSETWRQP